MSLRGFAGVAALKLQGELKNDSVFSTAILAAFFWDKIILFLKIYRKKQEIYVYKRCFIVYNFTYSFYQN